MKNILLFILLVISAPAWSAEEAEAESMEAKPAKAKMTKEQCEKEVWRDKIPACLTKKEAEKLIRDMSEK